MKSVSAAAGRRPRHSRCAAQLLPPARLMEVGGDSVRRSVGRSVGGAAFVPAIRPLSLPLAAAFIVARHSTTRARALRA